jgi:DNA-binding NarL/FixJ family response regulator
LVWAGCGLSDMTAQIIVADNHTLFRGALRDLLNQQPGWEVIAEAADGRSAAECCRRLRPDLLVMDLGLPDVDGLDLIRTIERDSPSTDVLVVNRYDENPILLAESLEAGASGYILKSASPQEITNAVTKALEGASPVDKEVATQVLLRLLGKVHMEPSSSLGPNPSRGEAPEWVALPASLTPREVEVLRLMAQGCTNRLIAKNLFISVSTVKKHVQRIIHKLGVSTRTQAALKAADLGLLGVREGR